MASQEDTLQVVAQAANEMEASLMVQFLEAHGITARAVGGFTSGFKAEAPGGVSVLVKSSDLEQAALALVEVGRGD